MSAEGWTAIVGLALEIFIGVVIVYAKIVRVETMLAPIVTWFHGERVQEAATLKSLELDRARREAL